jgi:hypothetical protein
MLLTGGFVLGSQLFGLLPWALSGAILTPDGQWILIDGRGRRFAAVLSADVRLIPSCVLLRWQSQPGHRWALVVKSASNSAVFRRLRVRLRFS